MSSNALDGNQGSPTRPYLIRALHDWCTDNGFTPYVAVFVDASVQVPSEYVKNNEIVLNVGFEATSALKLGNETIEFKARFGGTSREIVVPIDHVIAIYARENGQGMAFPAPAPAVDSGNDVPASPTGPARMPLRDASRGTEGDAGKIVHLVTGEEGGEVVDADSAGAPTDPVDEPPRPPAGGGSRPSLKRIK